MHEAASAETIFDYFETNVELNDKTYQWKSKLNVNYLRENLKTMYLRHWDMTLYS